MREIVGISCLLLGVAMLLSQVDLAQDAAAAKPQAAVARWVRTVEGWERSDAWKMEVEAEPALHPWVVAAGEGLLSVMGLVAFSREGR